jgi:hypothetical protein
MPGMVHQNAPHHLRGDAEELRPVLPAHSPLTDQPEVRLMDERGALERMAGRLAR